MKCDEFIILNMVITSMLSRLWWVLLLTVASKRKLKNCIGNKLCVFSFHGLNLPAFVLYQGDFPWHPGRPVRSVSEAPEVAQRGCRRPADALPQRLLPASRHDAVPRPLWCVFTDQKVSTRSSCQRAQGEEEEEIIRWRQEPGTDEEGERGPGCSYWKRWAFSFFLFCRKHFNSG